MHKIGNRGAAADGQTAVRCAMTLIVIALIAVTVYLLNLHTPLMLDDYDYSFSWATGKPLESIADVLKSQMAHYRLWGGRSVVHTFTQGFLYLGKGLFNYANTLMYLLLLVEIGWLAAGLKAALRWQNLLCIHLILFLCMPVYGTVFLWLDGACNYLWGTALALVPLLLEKEKLYRKLSGIGGCLFCGIVCFLAGWTNENTALGILFVRTVWVAMKAGNEREVPKWWWITLVCEALGMALMLLSPGNAVRSGGLSDPGSLAKRGVIVLGYVAAYAVPFVAAAAAAAAVQEKTVSFKDEGALFMGAGVLSGLAMIGSPEFSARTLTGMFALLLAGVMHYANRWYGEKTRLKRALLLLYPALLLAAAFYSYQACKAVESHEMQWKRELSKIETAARSGQEQASIKNVRSVSRYTMDIVYGEDPEAWPNSTLAKWYGLCVTGEGD